MKYEIYIFEAGKTASFLKKAIAEYEKRLSRYCKISCHFVKKQREWDKITEQNPERITVTAGKGSVSSEMFAKQIRQWESGGRGKLVFCISEKVPEDSCQVCNLSDFTMSCKMTAMVLYEQIYRGYRILHHHPYHK